MDQTTPKRTRSRPRGQILVVAVIAMISMIGGVALILDGGNAYAHQRGVQNGADAVANAGATVIAQAARRSDQDRCRCRGRRQRDRNGQPAGLGRRVLHEPGRRAAQ